MLSRRNRMSAANCSAAHASGSGVHASCKMAQDLPICRPCELQTLEQTCHPTHPFSKFLPPAQPLLECHVAGAAPHFVTGA
eukprot:5459524-Pleurochrysis_carterae.AAC.1